MANEATSQHAEAVGEIVQAEVAAAESTAAAVVEVAQHQVEEAQKQATEIARAAIETQLGQNIETLTTEMRTWQNQHEARLAEMEEDSRMIQDGLTRALELLAQAVTPAPSASIPTPQPEAPAPQTPPAGPTPEVKESVVALPAPPISEPRKAVRRAI